MRSTARTSENQNRIDYLVEELTREGIVLLPNLLSASQLTEMQRSFNVCLKQLRWNNYDGYEKTEPYRHMVEDILTLDQGFVDATLHPMVTGVLRSYLGDRFELVEAKGWKSIPSRRDFHGWHADAWYDQNGLTEIPKEVKLAIYLTNVKTGAFNYIRRSHRQQHPRMVKAFELQDRTKSEILELTGPAGTAFLFDTSGIHRQSVPILEPRCAVFYNYHDPSVKLDRENIEHYRYHPLLLNAAFLGGLSEEDARILGFGNTTNYIPAFANPVEPGILHKAFNMAHNLNLFADKYVERVRARLDKLRS